MAFEDNVSAEIINAKRDFTLVFVHNEKKGELLLGMKKRGFGFGYWNGFGGKVEPGEKIIQAAHREIAEECGLQVELDEEFAVIEYEFTKEPGVRLVSNIFLTSKFSGNLQESEEMLPKWWLIDEIPYHNMWPDSKLWYKYLFKKQKFNAYFLMDDSNQVVKYTIKDNDVL